MAKKEEFIDLSKLSVSERAKIATQIGEDAGKIIEASLKKANKMLKKYGYAVSVDLKFHECEKEAIN